MFDRHAYCIHQIVVLALREYLALIDHQVCPSPIWRIDHSIGKQMLDCVSACDFIAPARIYKLYAPSLTAKMHAKFLRDNPKMKMLIQGNTDERGSREYNLALGQKRSDGVKRMLMLLGVKEDQLESVSLGEEKPRAQGSSEDAWAQNRRAVTVTID